MPVLTEEQRASLWGGDGKPLRGLRIVSARAGTGKTHTLCEYVADTMAAWPSERAPWQGIALLSYTNVASRELDAKLSRDGRCLPIGSYPHYTGTIDSFVNQFVFLPHGASSMGAPGRPKLVGEPHAAWSPGSPNPVDRYFSGVTYNLDSTVSPDPGKLAMEFQRSKETVEGQMRAIESRKRALTAKRYATQADANFFAYRTLKEQPRIAKSLAVRFPLIVIDEAQDMTEAQHAMLEALVEAGLSDVVLIGDERQAIYEWNTARPELFVAKVKSDSWKDSTVSGSFRCSGSVCDALNSLSADVSLRPVPGSRNEGYADPVEVVEFDANAANSRACLAGIVDGMAAALAHRVPHAGESAYIELAVLTRGRDDASHLRSLYLGDSSSGRPSFSAADRRTKSFLSAAYHAYGGNSVKAFSAYERLLASCGDFDDRESMRDRLTKAWFGTAGTRLDYRIKVLSVLAAMGSALGTASAGGRPCLEHCVALVNLDLSGINEAKDGIGADLRKYDPAAPRRRGVPAPPTIPLGSLFATDESRPVDPHPAHNRVRLTFSTIHGVKGETYDGVVLVIRKKGSSCGCPDSSSLNLRVAGHDIIHCEGKRLQYVAASRAVQKLCVAVESDPGEWERLLASAVPGPE